MTPQQLTTENFRTPPDSLEEGLDELKLIHETLQQQAKLDQLPLLVKRTTFLKQHLEAGLLAIEHEIQHITTDPASEPARPPAQAHTAQVAV